MVPENRLDEAYWLYLHGLAPDGVEKLLDYVVKPWIGNTAIFSSRYSKFWNQYSNLGPECVRILKSAKTEVDPHPQRRKRTLKKKAESSELNLGFILKSLSIRLLACNEQ